MANAISYTAIATAIANRFSSTYVTAPTGEDAIRTSNYLAPQGLHTPCVVVYMSGDSNIGYHLGMMVTSTQTWTVRFYLAAPADYARNLASLLNWRTAIYAALDGQVELGLSYINTATVTAIGPFGELPFGTAPGEHGYPGFELTVEVQTRDNRSFVA